MAIGLMLLAAAAPTAARATTCAASRNQAQAQASANTRDPDHDGIYCESLPCPCSRAERRGATRSTRARRRKAQKVAARITAVVDGDTIKVSARGASRRSYTVRIIGIDTPETRKPGTPIECGGPQASAQMQRLAFLGERRRRVWLTTDPTQALFDRYRRLLAYVNARDSGSDIGRLLIRAGWAKVYVFNGVPFRRISAYRESSKRARRARAGVFGHCRGNFHRPR